MISDDEIIRRWDAGERMTDIADRLGLTRERVRQRLERNGRSGPNRNALPAAGELLTAAVRASTLKELSSNLEFSLHVLKLALDERGVREQVEGLIQANKKARLEARRRAAQRPYIDRIRRLALQVGHTPTIGELAGEGMYHATFQQLFGSARHAMIAAGLEPNVPGNPPQDLPLDFGSDWEPTADAEILERRSSQLRRSGMAVTPPAGNSHPEKQELATSAYYRDPAVVAWIWEIAEGVCEACGQQGYETDDDLLFLEVHHVVSLSEGGPDVITNAVAVCETCHGKLHRWKYREALRERLYATITRLIRP